jgi:large subunit ribosomal protein L17
MRHGHKINHLGRKSQHRKALLANLAISLIEHKHIVTTTAKAKALRTYVEPLINKAKENTTHSRRVVYSYLANKDAVTTLFNVISEKIAARPGGFTRIIKLDPRRGDAAEMALIELVDFSLLNGETSSTKKETATKTKRSRRGGAKKTGGTDNSNITKVDTKKNVTPKSSGANTPKIRQRKSGGA